MQKSFVLGYDSKKFYHMYRNSVSSNILQNFTYNPSVNDLNLMSEYKVNDLKELKLKFL
jgi:hypothetical protein